eukprot:3785979-Karenia_brevis.AAC.1
MGGRLRPHYVAVGVRAMAKITVQALRQWWERNRDNFFKAQIHGTQSHAGSISQSMLKVAPC